MPNPWSDDDELLAALAEALHPARGVPPEFVAAGKAAYAWHDIDAELAALAFDSALADQPVSAATRARRAALRALTFTSASVTIELEIGEDVLLGQLVPPRPGAVEVQVVTGDVVTAEVDEVGGFAVRPLPPASFRLRCRTADGGDVLTGWIDP